MKKSRLFLLVVLYCVVCFGTIWLQWVSIQSPKMKIMVNLGTFFMAILALGMVFFQNKNMKITNEPLNNSILETTKLPSKELYLIYAEYYQFTKREKEIGFMVLNGYSNAMLSEELYISEATVKKHLSHIYEKTKTKRRSEFKESVLRYCGEKKSTQP